MRVIRMSRTARRSMEGIERSHFVDTRVNDEKHIEQEKQTVRLPRGSSLLLLQR